MHISNAKSANHLVLRHRWHSLRSMYLKGMAYCEYYKKNPLGSTLVIVFYPHFTQFWERKYRMQIYQSLKLTFSFFLTPRMKCIIYWYTQVWSNTLAMLYPFLSGKTNDSFAPAYQSNRFAKGHFCTCLINIGLNVIELIIDILNSVGHLFIFNIPPCLLIIW